jgi:hypothetical protein
VECETRFSINGLRRLRRSFGIRHRGSSMGEHGLTAAAPRVHPHNEFGRMKTASRPIGAVLALAVAVGLTASLGCTARHRAPLVPEPVGAPVSVVSRGASDRDMYGAGDLWPTRFRPWIVLGGGAESLVSGAGPDVPSPQAPAREEMAMTTIFVIAAVVACCALCAYGISRVVRRSRERRTQRA